MTKKSWTRILRVSSTRRLRRQPLYPVCWHGRLPKWQKLHRCFCSCIRASTGVVKKRTDERNSPEMTRSPRMTRNTCLPALDAVTRLYCCVSSSSGQPYSRVRQVQVLAPALLLLMQRRVTWRIASMGTASTGAACVVRAGRVPIVNTVLVKSGKNVLFCLLYKQTCFDSQIFCIF